MPEPETRINNSNKASGKSEKIKVLLLEDDPYFFELYTNRLRGGDFNVVVEADEDEGFKKVFDYKPDLIILDISLPKDDDFGFISRVKEKSEISSTPIIVLTDLNDEYSKKKGLSAGAIDYLVRDEISFSKVIESIKKHSNKK